jgi:hypothetical protein
MTLNANQIPLETKWSMAAKGLTGALTAHLNALHGVVGKEKYAEIIREIWAQIGRGSAELVHALGLSGETAKAVGEAGATMCMCAMGPEYNISEIESTDDRTVMKITACPWKNRMDEFGVAQDLLSACDTAFWNSFVKSLNPNVTMRHGKQMHKGDSHCEWIFETKKS